ncbi:MAG: hypothetical protein GX801_02065 [Fibrobacter sp.]|nr:hypothetical protein [Fibrobacter sp.]
MIFSLKWWLLISFLLILSCASGSVQYVLVQDAQDSYKHAAKEYHKVEDEYIVLLFNLERYPEDSFLVEQKKTLMKELDHLRNIMLHSRLEFDESVQEWDAQITGNMVIKGQKVPTLDTASLRPLFTPN